MPQKTLHEDNNTLPRVLVIGTDSGVLTEGSEHRARMLRYASTMRELHIIVLGAQGMKEECVQIGEHVYAYPTRSVSRAKALVEGLRIGKKIVAHHAIDIISTQDPFECALIGYLLKRRCGARLQIQEHGDFFSQSYWRRERLLHQVRYVVGLWLIHRADCVRVVSERIKRGLVARGIPEERIVSVPVATDISMFQRAVPDERIAPLRPEGGVLILTMARLVPQKNLTLLIDAFRIILKQGVCARLVILGKGPEKGALLSRVQGCTTIDTCASDPLTSVLSPRERRFTGNNVVPSRLKGEGWGEGICGECGPSTENIHQTELLSDTITFLDWTDDAAGAMKAADIYALSSNYEGWGRVCIEALAVGTPLLMTDVGCAGEVVRDGENGLVVPVDNVQAYAGALMRLASDVSLRDRLAQAGTDTLAGLETSDEHMALYEKSLKCCIVHQRDQDTETREDRLR